jgi:hypothetical protein
VVSLVSLLAVLLELLATCTVARRFCTPQDDARPEPAKMPLIMMTLLAVDRWERSGRRTVAAGHPPGLAFGHQGESFALSLFLQ